jgi:hypothetical protein
MKKSIFSLILLISFPMFSQQVRSGYTVITAKQRLDLTRTFETEEKNIQGSPYLAETFLPANVSGYQGVFLLRYNAHKDEMEFQKDEEILYLVKSDSLEVDFLNSKKKYSYLEYKSGKEIIKGFLIVVSNGEKISLFKKEKVNLIPKVEATNTYARDSPARYELQKDTFFIKMDGVIVPFPKNKKELLKMFPDKENPIVDFIKNNDISFSKENDVINLVKFLNSI